MLLSNFSFYDFRSHSLIRLSINPSCFKGRGDEEMEEMRGMIIQDKQGSVREFQFRGQGMERKYLVYITRVFTGNCF